MTVNCHTTGGDTGHVTSRGDGHVPEHIPADSRLDVVKVRRKHGEGVISDSGWCCTEVKADKLEDRQRRSPRAAIFFCRGVMTRRSTTTRRLPPVTAWPLFGGRLFMRWFHALRVAPSLTPRRCHQTATPKQD